MSEEDLDKNWLSINLKANEEEKLFLQLVILSYQKTLEQHKQAIEYITNLKCNCDEKVFDILLEILGDKENE